MIDIPHYWILFAVLIYTLTAGAEELCFGEGLQPNHTSDCRQYFRCQSGHITRSYSCPEGSAFSISARQCLPRNRVPCVRHICHREDNSMYASPETQCRSYYKCRDGTATELACPSGSWFDFKKQQCSRNAGICYEPVCTGQIDGKHLDTTQNCRRMLLCSGGVLRGVESSYSNSVHCPSPRATAVAFPIASSDPCAALSDGGHTSPNTDCRKYLVCRDGATVSSERCPQYQRFNGNKCVSDVEFKCTDECSSLSDGFHVDLTSGCTDYFYCKNNTNLFRTTCPEGNVFDGLMCVSPAFYTCPSILKKNPCIKRQDGFHRDFKDCRSFYYCKSEEITFRDSCPDSHVWNGESCVDQNEFQCTGPINWSGCQEKAPGFYQDTSPGSDCKNYYHCSNNFRMNFVCPRGQVFDGEKCVNAQYYTCPSLDRDSCDNKQDGLYQQTSGGCRAYYMCSKNYKITYLCDVGFSFDGEKCVDNQFYTCPYATDDCVGKVDGYHQDVKSNCRKYYFCENEEKLTTIQCSGSKVFNGQGCVNPKDYECPVGESGNPCIFKEDGYYMQSKTHCKNYYKCSNRAVVSRNSCPDGQIFDGLSSCITKKCSAQIFTCERNGFFADLSNDCRSYFLCTEGRKSVIYCDRGKVFNGELCVSEQNYQCPDDCSTSQCSNTISSIAPY